MMNIKNKTVDKSFEFLIIKANEVYGVNVLKVSRKTINTWARMAVASKLQFKYTLFEIGKFLNKDHSTISYYHRKHIDCLKFDKKYKEYFEIFEMKCLAPIDREKYGLQFMKNKVEKINIQLYELEYTPDQILLLWNECTKDIASFVLEKSTF